VFIQASSPPVVPSARSVTPAVAGSDPVTPQPAMVMVMVMVMVMDFRR